MNLSKQTKVILALAGAATGTSTLTSSTIDTQGFEGVMFVGSLTTVNAGNFAKARQGQQSNMSDAADLVNTKLVPGDNGDSFLIDIHKPQERYVDIQIVRAGITTITGDVYAILYGPRKLPTTQGATIDAETHVSPAEGTA
jgi:hypothetical protein